MIDLPDATAPDCRRIAQQYLRDEPAFLTSLQFGPFVAQGQGSGPSVLMGDQSEISLYDSSTSARLDHRMALLAANGDTVLVRRREAAFEAYLADYLGLDQIRFFQVDGDPMQPVADQVRGSRSQLAALASTARHNDGLTLKAYLTTGRVWNLAKSIGEASGRCVHVCGPSPRATQRANDKLWFAELVRKVLGKDATPPTLAAFGPAGAAGWASRISGIADQVIVKVPDSAGSTGNVRLASTLLRKMSLAKIRQTLLDRLYSTGWQGIYPILVGVWDESVSRSPSVQLWIPHETDGPPMVEGVFEQHVSGETAAFVGGARSTLPTTLQNQLGSQAVDIATILQELGFLGRCSFDTVICDLGDPPGVIHWIECNGRWGGVSIPMTTAARLRPDRIAPTIAIAQEVLPGGVLRTKELVQHLKDILYQQGKNEEGLVIMSPSENPEGASVNLLAIADMQNMADGLLAEAMSRLAALFPKS